jgi:hypothetical protein
MDENDASQVFDLMKEHTALKWNPEATFLVFIIDSDAKF